MIAPHDRDIYVAKGKVDRRKEYTSKHILRHLYIFSNFLKIVKSYAPDLSGLK